MVFRTNILPLDDRLGAVTGIEYWHRLTDTTWEILNTTGKVISSWPSTGALGFRFYYDDRVTSDPTAARSDIMEGWDFYSLVRGGQTVEIWRGDDRDELVREAPVQASIFDAGLLTNEKWDEVTAEMLDVIRGKDW